MLTNSTPHYRHTPIHSGPDWITATAKHGRNAWAFEDLANEYLQKKRDAGGEVRSASRLGYRGYEAKHFFWGRRPEDDVLIVSSREAAPLAKPIIDIADNVSRLDLSVIVWTHGEQCNLAQENYRKLCALPHQRARAGKITLTTSKPDGDTLYVNKRTSDHFGRLYDKAAESKTAPTHTLWTYEVEIKRRAALAVASAYSAADSRPSYTRNYVARWWATKGVDVTYRTDDGSLDESHLLKDKTTDVLSWFENSVSITVRKAVNRFGLEAVVSALGLSPFVTINKKGGQS